MNAVRKSGYYAALACALLAVAFGACGLITGDDAGMGEFAIALCGAGLFFASARAIIPKRVESVSPRDRLDVLGEVCASGFYAGVLCVISYMGLPYFQALLQPSQTEVSTFSMLGSVVFFSGFAFSLIAHLASAISAAIEMQKLRGAQ